MIRLNKIKSAIVPIDPSRALFSDIYVPTPPGLSLEPYQKAAVEYASKRSRTLIADDPGSGKTPMSISVANLFPDIAYVLIICPGFLKPHWNKEWQRWDVKHLSVGIIEGQKGEFPSTSVVIINYKLLKYHHTNLCARVWDLVIIDEVHKLKNKKSDRTRYVFGGIKRDKNKRIIERVDAIPFKMTLALTGTPSLNGKPKELWPLLQHLDADGLGRDWFTFAKRYCDLEDLKRYDPETGKLEHFGWKWDGVSNEEELQVRMRERFMVRRLKAEIMPQLPAKRRMIIPIVFDKSLKKRISKESIQFDKLSQEKGAVWETEFDQFSKLMHEIGMALVDVTREIVESDLEEFEKIVVMCYHRDVAEQIAYHFGTQAVLIHGDVPPADRQGLVDRFQQDPKIRVAVGTIGAMGVGFTMTAAPLMIFPERNWVPGDITQAEDRIHRRGQNEQVLIKHIVLEGTQSERQTQVLIEKQNSIDKMLDNKPGVVV